MRSVLCGLVAAAALASQGVHAAEGPSIAGPIGGTDMRSAMLPPPGLYAGAVGVAAQAYDFVDGNGKPIPALSEARLHRLLGGPFVAYVPDVQVFGGSVGLVAVVPYGVHCGQLFPGIRYPCQSGFGDAYTEGTWSRFFGTVRPSPSGAFPIAEGLTVAAGFGMVIPIGQYNATDATTRVTSNGANIWDFAPHLALTYTTPPILVDGTEFSAKMYYNTYRPNPTTGYHTGDIFNIDFALTEHLGRVQAGLAGFYVKQLRDDTINGVVVAPDGARVELLSLGGVIALDLPEFGAFIKVKALETVQVVNTAHARGVSFTLVKKVY